MMDGQLFHTKKQWEDRIGWECSGQSVENRCKAFVITSRIDRSVVKSYLTHNHVKSKNICLMNTLPRLEKKKTARETLRAKLKSIKSNHKP
uniref:FLYWCH-type domain-containing protein n=2 Tax=Anopheles albimanus TaxID=7167 RepID=A0A182FXA4_ANOAL